MSRTGPMTPLVTAANCRVLTEEIHPNQIQLLQPLLWADMGSRRAPLLHLQRHSAMGVLAHLVDSVRLCRKQLVIVSMRTLNPCHQAQAAVNSYSAGEALLLCCWKFVWVRTRS